MLAPMRQLSLHHLTAMDLTPVELVAAAAAVGLSRVTLFTYVPPPYQSRYPLVTEDILPRLQEAMARHGVACQGLEVFGLTEEPDWPGMAQGLRLGGLLGAAQATVHIHDSAPDRVHAHLAQLAEMAAAHGIELALEFNPYAQCRSLAQAVEMVKAMAAQSVRIGILLDTLHAMRSGATLAEIEAAAPYIVGLQLSDGPQTVAEDQRWREAISARLLPGQGDFPLQHIVKLLPETVVIDIEVPQAPAKAAGQSAQMRIKGAADATRALLK